MDQGSPRPLAIVLPLAATVAAMASFQIGAAVAKSLFPAVGPVGAVTLRLVLGAAMLLALTRPWRAWPRPAPVGRLVLLGVSRAATIVAFYEAIARLPLGIAIALLGVSALTRKWWLVWVGVGFSAFGLLMEVAGFLQWSIHPDKIAAWLS